jgi:hypothetical protein
MQARTLLAASRFQAAEPLLSQAAASGHAEALHDLGRLLLFYDEDGSRRGEGHDCLLRAEAAGHAGAAYVLAGIALGGILEPCSIPRCNQRLGFAARAGHPEALRAHAISWLGGADPGEKRLGMLCLEHAALKGDIVSLALLCDQLAAGHPPWSGESHRARALLALGAHAGVPSALASAPPQDHAPAPIPPPPALPDPFPALDFFESATIEPTELCSSPRVRLARGLLTGVECAFVIHAGAPYLQPSVTVGPDGRRVQVPLRTSHDMEFEAVLEDFSLRLLQRRMAAVAGLPLSHGEWLTLLRYGAGQEYRPHRDYLPPSHVLPLENGGPGQRQATAIAYLNDVAQGGHTHFPELDVRVRPESGSVLAFDNLDAAGQPDPRSLHAGEPVKGASVKWICTLWMRQGPLRPF